MIDLNALQSVANVSLKNDEGYSQFLAPDTGGTHVIGYGLNVDLEGVSRSEADWLLDSKIMRCISDLIKALPWFSTLDVNRQSALVNMRYNLGLPRFMQFKKMLAALAVQDWNTAYKECLDSDAARSLVARYTRLAKTLKGGGSDEPTAT